MSSLTSCLCLQLHSQADELEVSIRGAPLYSINSASIGPRTSTPSYMRWLTSPRFLPASARINPRGRPHYTWKKAAFQTRDWLGRYPALLARRLVRGFGSSSTG